MGCNCGKRNKSTWTLTTTDGQTSEHGTKLEAEAEKQRRGGGVVARKV